MPQHVLLNGSAVSPSSTSQGHQSSGYSKQNDRLNLEVCCYPIWELCSTRSLVFEMVCLEQRYSQDDLPGQIVLCPPTTVTTTL